MSTALGRGAPILHPTGDLRRRLLDPDSLAARQARADRLLAAEGAGHLVHDLPVRADGRTASLESRPWRIDPIPLVLDAGTFQWLSLCVAERMEALEAVVRDLYGARSLVAERVVPAEALASTGRYRVDAVGSTPRRWITTYAVDVVLDADGMWWHVQDLVDAPPGLGYALLDRSVMTRVLPDLSARADVVSLARFPSRLLRALAATSTVDSPRTVVYSAGIDHPSYVDHSYLAVQLGVNLVEGADLVVRQRKVWLRTLDGLEPVDVLYRRVEDPKLDPLAVAAVGNVGVPGLLLAERAGGVSLANAHGAGVVEDPAIVPFVRAAIDRLAPLTQTLPEYDGSVPTLASVPLAPGSISPDLDHTSAVVRLFAVHDGERVHVLPGGTGRVLAPGDDPAEPTACTAKDVWVLGWTPAPVVEPPRLPQVDFGRSVPTRAADALYWTNRAAERAEAMARTMRVISARLEQDPGLATMSSGAWCERMGAMTDRVIRRSVGEPLGSGPELSTRLSEVGDAVAAEIGALLAEATTVREFLSVTTGRVLSHLAELRSSLQRHVTVVDDLDAVLADFAAIAGLWQESTVRGPAWRIGDTGRRLERCLVVVDLLEGALDLDRQRPDTVAPVLEVLLAANDSLVAYRRRHRSEIEPELAVRLLVNDQSNPRSLAASVDRLAEHVDDGENALGERFVESARACLLLPPDRMIPELRELIESAGTGMVGRWFSTPVDPIPMTFDGPGTT
ncbi:MAG: circularly permuted type 2 ATP-grasp protein [Ilumatobacter fluminis]|uniref:circularly permuted type 2 ATP-grasp protein n=1 Tax=Ilumatobacter fluminis TaxID=467091 RepID=UPI0032EC2630